MAAERGGATEGLAWLGRTPEVRASRTIRVLARLARFVLFGLLRFQVDATGGDPVPSGGYLLVGAVHRGWMDPFLVMHALPLEPRVWFLGSGPSAFDARWKEWLLHRLGGMLPVWRGGVGVEQHVASAKAVLDVGGVFVLMPEGGISGQPDELAPFRFGSALIALRTGAPIVPMPASCSACRGTAGCPAPAPATSSSSPGGSPTGSRSCSGPRSPPSTPARSIRRRVPGGCAGSPGCSCRADPAAARTRSRRPDPTPPTGAGPADRTRPRPEIPIPASEPYATDRAGRLFRDRVRSPNLLA
jgi:Acyltransferase